MLLHPILDQPLIQTILWGVPFFSLALFAYYLQKQHLTVKTVLTAFVGPAVLLLLARLMWGPLILYPGNGLYATILLLLSVITLTYYIILFEYLLYRFVRHCIMVGNDSRNNSFEKSSSISKKPTKKHRSLAISQ